MSPLRILALDTTAASGSLALAEEDSLIEQVEIDSPDGFGHILFQRIEALLDAHAIGVRDIGLFAAAAGPGSFTGVRVGLAAVKGLAAALGKPAIGISNLQALARLGHGDIRAAVIDARRGEVYAGLFNATLQPLAPETVIAFDSWRDTLPDGVNFVFAEAGKPLAASIAALAWTAYRTGGAGSLHPAAIDANYVRRSDAELSWTEG